MVGSSDNCDSVRWSICIFLSTGGWYILVLSLLRGLWRGAVQEWTTRYTDVCYHRPACACSTSAVVSWVCTRCVTMVGVCPLYMHILTNMMYKDSLTCLGYVMTMNYMFSLSLLHLTSQCWSGIVLRYQWTVLWQYRLTARDSEQHYRHCCWLHGWHHQRMCRYIWIMCT